MAEVKITYETLFDLVRREKSREELQELDATFYDDLLAYIKGKMALIKDKGPQSSLFGASESEKVKIQILNVKKLVKELYERRQMKIIKMASNRAKVGAGLMNTTAMLPEEKVFFEQSLNLFIGDREKVLNKVLFMDDHAKQFLFKEEFPDAFHGHPEPVSEHPRTAQEVYDDDTAHFADQSHEYSAEQEQPDVQEQEEDDSIEIEKPMPKPTVKDDYEQKVKIRFKTTVPKFIGKKLEQYGPYSEGDEAEVPVIIAKILVSKEKAENA